MLLAALFLGDRADGVLGDPVGLDVLGNDQVNAGEILVVVLHLGDVVQLLHDRLLGDAPDLDVACLVVEDGGADGELDVGCARAATTFAGLEVAHLSNHILGSGLVVKAEGLGLGAAGAPDLVILQGLVGQHGDADRVFVLEFAQVQVAAAA